MGLFKFRIASRRISPIDRGQRTFISRMTKFIRFEDFSAAFRAQANWPARGLAVSLRVVPLRKPLGGVCPALDHNLVRSSPFQRKRQSREDRQIPFRTADPFPKDPAV